MLQGSGGGRGIRFSLLLGHARGKTTLSCFLTLSRRFATRAFWANGFQEVYQRIPFQLSSVQFVLKQFLKSLILQGYSELFGTDMN